MSKDKEKTIPDLHVLTDLEQVKVIADPLRVRILEAFCEKACTTKQVAERLGEKPTRLYHHVDALERAGLIRLVETKPVRGTVEKYYAGIARRFKADPAVFRPGDPEGREALGETLRTVFDVAGDELQELVRTGYDVASTEEGIVSYLEVLAAEDEVNAIKEKLESLAKELAEVCCDAEPPEDARRYRLLLAYFPLDRTAKGD